jgi:hypothetical protein
MTQNNELESALLLIKKYENELTELKLENKKILRTFIHALSNPLQILSMTLESLQDKPNLGIDSLLNRMKIATDDITLLIKSYGKL